MKCPLCHSSGTYFFKTEFLSCSNCGAIYKNKQFYIDATAEKKRYLEHNNDVEDIGYQQFVSPITNYIFEHFGTADKGLDFGSGTGPVISKLLNAKQYQIVQYDPYFAPNTAVLEDKYHYIVSCEVIEHFHHPKLEFEKLYNLLLPGGALVCMTHLFAPEIDFTNWYYKNDPTHVFIYTEKTMAYIAKTFNFKSFEIEKRRVIFKK